MPTTVISSNVVGPDIPVYLSTGDMWILGQGYNFITWTTGYPAGLFGDPLNPGVSINVLGTFMAAQVQLAGGDRLAVGRLGSMQTTTLAGIELSADPLHGPTTVVNEGTIQSHFLAGSAALTVTVADTTALGTRAFGLTNSGLIVGTGKALDLSGTGLVEITNSGTIQGEIDAVAGPTRLQNTGTITGSILLGSADDLLVNAGTIAGDIDMGAGNDVLDLRHGVILGPHVVQGGAGDDTYWVDSADLDLADSDGIDTVRASVDFLLATGFESLVLLSGARDGTGNTAANTITGNASANRLAGDEGNDTLNGRAGADTLAGELGNDSLDGGAGDDLLTGGAGVDTLWGGAGDDTLIGGTGRDSLRGGEGADVFVFGRANHSPAALPDVIADFTSGEDVIDLSGIDANTANALPNDAFTFIGAAAFGNVAGQLRFQVVGSVTWLYMDTNGDAMADITLRLAGIKAPEAGDFLL